MKLKLTLLYLLISHSIFGQISANSGIFFAKEFSKDIALYKAKSFVMNDVIGLSDKTIKFEIDPLAASVSGQLTSLVYVCSEKNLEGLIMGFYGERWNENGVVYQSYAFRNFSKSNAIELLNKIEKLINENSDYLSQNQDNNNLYFKYEDCLFLIYKDYNIIKIRAFWNNFDSDWEYSAFKRTKRYY